MAEPPAKRARMDDEPANSGLLQDEDFWFDDGNVILVAGEVQFRVYMGPLMRHAPIFADMFSFPQPPDQAGIQPQENRVPTVYLADSPSDLRHFLRCITLGKDLMFKHISADTSFDRVSAIVRLSHKYQVAQLLAPAIECLEARYPASLTAYWKRREVLPDFDPQYAIAAINLARVTETPSILLAAFMDCCCLTPEELMHGLERSGHQQEMLSDEDLRRVLIARTKVTKADVQLALRILMPEVSPTCRTAPHCVNAFVDGLKGLSFSLKPSKPYKAVGRETRLSKSQPLGTPA